MHFRKPIIYLCTACFMLFSPVSAQKKAQATSTIKKTSTTNVQKAMNVDECFNNYQFSEAATLLQKEIAAAKKLKKPTAQLEAKLSKAMKGFNMLQGTEKVQIIDSMVVDKQNFLSAYKLCKESGSVLPMQTFLQRAQLSIANCGETTYVNELGDVAFYATKDSLGTLKLFRSDCFEGKWSTPHKLKGLTEAALGSQDYPFVLSDGTTLYFAAQNEDGLGGYDIFVTRLKSDTREYVKPENIGMPYNSPFNDYMYAVDEQNNLGWFASDRFQPHDKVCIYIFLPNAVRDVYNQSETPVSKIRSAAKIQTIAATQYDTEKVAEGVKRLRNLQTNADDDSSTSSFFCLLDDSHVYRKITDFTKPEARTIALQWSSLSRRYVQAQKRLEALRKAYAASEDENRKALSSQILNLEKSSSQMKQQIDLLINNLRKVEVGI